MEVPADGKESFRPPNGNSSVLADMGIASTMESLSTNNQNLRDPTGIDDTSTIDVDDGRDTTSSKITREHRQMENDLNTSQALQNIYIETRRPRTRRKSFVGIEAETTEQYFRKSRSRSKSCGRKSRSQSRVSNASSTVTSTGRTPKRTNMRSANVEFAKKHQKFLEKVTAHNESEGSDDEVDDHDATNWDEQEIQAPPKVSIYESFIFRDFVVKIYVVT